MSVLATEFDVSVGVVFGVIFYVAMAMSYYAVFESLMVDFKRRYRGIR